MKTCTKCGRELPLTCFDRDSRPDRGHYSSCKECKAEYRRTHKDKLLQSQYERRRRKFDKIAPQRKAWNAIYYAAITGRLDRPDECSICGAHGNIQAHHHDYSKPFDVVWVCQDCHVALDNKRRDAV